MLKVLSVIGNLIILKALSVSCEDDEEIWVGVEDRLEMFKSGSHMGSFQVEGARHVISMATSDTRVFLSELGFRGPSVYSVDRQMSQQKLLARDNSSTNFPHLAYDSGIGRLYLASRDQGAILSLDVGKGETRVKTFFSDARKTPRGLDFDVCSRSLIWTQTSNQRPSLEVLLLGERPRSHLLVSGRAKSRPGAVSVDQEDRAVFWLELYKGTASIQKTKLDSGETVEVCSLTDQHPSYLQVTASHIYWTDGHSQALWRTKKEGDCNPENLFQFQSARPYGLTWLRKTPVKCHGNSKQIFEKFSTENVTELVEENTTEISVEPEACLNFCLSGGFCSLGPLSLPVCSCPAGLSGDRCEKDVCSNFCLGENSSCVVMDGEPQCLCPHGLRGERCHLVEPQTISLLGFAIPLPQIPLLILVLLVLSLCLFISLAILAIWLHKLRRRPRLKRKRFISVHKSNQGYESGPSLDIEDCCNMTLCDTPCIEPPTRGPGSQKRGKICGSRTTGDKSSLLDHQDEEE